MSSNRTCNGSSRHADCLFACSNDKADEWLGRFRDRTAEIFPKKWPQHVRRVKVAILDTGIDELHPYLRTHWKRPKQCANGANLVDRGYVDFLDDTENHQHPVDTCGHGTHMAGIILQLLPHAELYVARVMEDEIYSSDATVSQAKRIAKVRIYRGRDNQCRL